MKSIELENMFFSFFEKNGYIKFNEISLIPKEDTTLLFTNSGMVQFKNVFLGIENINFDKIVTSQTCVRVGGKHNDFKNIGLSPHHNTSFKMLGNFGFKNVLKKNVIQEAWNFLINDLLLNVSKLHVSVHKNDKESLYVWKDIIGINEINIFFGDDESNFWSMDKVGPCGYCTEIFYNIDADGINLLEIWNLVFIQFNKQNNKLNSLNRVYLDTGLGLERITSVVQKCYNNFETDIYKPLIQSLTKSFNVALDYNKSINIIVDHIKTATLLLKENILPGNDKREYILKKLIRRAIVEKSSLKIKKKLWELDDEFFYLIDNKNNVEFIKNILKTEEIKFTKTLEFGNKYFNKILQANHIVTNKDLFILYDTYGVPLDLIKNLSLKNNLTFNMFEFNEEMTKQIEKSKIYKLDDGFNFNLIKNVIPTIFKGYSRRILKTKIIKIIKDDIEVNELYKDEKGIIVLEQSCFYAEKGGQIGDVGKIKSSSCIFQVHDTQELSKIYLHYGCVLNGVIKKNDDVFLYVDKFKRKNCSNNHSATHLLHTVLKNILGTHVKQMGSLITANYFRFDFTHFNPLNKFELNRIEFLINKYIRMKLDVFTDIYFDFEKFEEIRTVSIGGNVSKELCGGTHASNTEDLFLFKIIKEYGIGNNIRRLECITGFEVIKNFINNEKILENISNEVKVNKDIVFDNVKKLITKNKELEKENFDLLLESVNLFFQNDKNLVVINNIKILILSKSLNYINVLPKFMSNLFNVIVIFYFKDKNNIKINLNFSKNLNYSFGALDIINYIKKYVNINGGGTKYIAHAIIKDSRILSDDISKIILSYLYENLAIKEEENVNFN